MATNGILAFALYLLVMHFAEQNTTGHLSKGLSYTLIPINVMYDSTLSPSIETYSQQKYIILDDF